jgi:hypothetical protein
MLDRLTGLPLHRFFYIVALILIAIGVSLNKVVMSVGTIMLISSWVLEGEFDEKWKRMKGNLPFIIGISFFLLHILGLLWTSDFQYAFHDLRSKLPILVIPFVLGSIEPIEKFEYKTILFAFVSSVFITSLLNYLIANGVISSGKEIQNFRDYSIFISHIRFSLMIDFAIYILIYFLIKNAKATIIWVPILIWLLYYSYFSQIISGFIYFFVLAIVSLLFVVLKSKNRLFIYSTIAVSISILVLSGLWINSIVQDYYSKPQESAINPEMKTVNGNQYHHNYYSEMRENGYLIYWYVCPEEIEKEWTKRERTNLDEFQEKTHGSVRSTLYRYMASKGYRKDSLGMSKMTDEDIQNVLNGITNPIQLEKGMKSRVHGLITDYEHWKMDADPNGKTLLQRFSFWEAGLAIFKSNFLYGVGTGDNQKSFDQYYEETDSKLAKENRHRSHNQFLSVGVCFGVFGLLIFLIFLFYPLYFQRGKIEFLHVIFICLMLMSFLPEDTLETQSGISFFALFYSLFFYRKRS